MDFYIVIGENDFSRNVTLVDFYIVIGENDFWHGWRSIETCKGIATSEFQHYDTSFVQNMYRPSLARRVQSHQLQLVTSLTANTGGYRTASLSFLCIHTYATTPSLGLRKNHAHCYNDYV